MDCIDNNIYVAIIAAAAALFGAAVGQLGPLVLHWRAGRRERKNFLRGIYEEMTGLVMRSHLEARRAGMNLLVPRESSVALLLSDTRRISTLTTLYFPELKLSADRAFESALSVEISVEHFEVLIKALGELEAACEMLSSLICEHRKKYT